VIVRVGDIGVINYHHRLTLSFHNDLSPGVLQE